MALPNFSPAEIACRGTGKLLINAPALDKLQALRDRLGKPLIVRSAYRSSACAKQPEAVAPAQFDHRPMMQFSCASLRQKEQEGMVAVDSFSAIQKAAADNDALGVFLLGLPLASMSGNDPETQLSIAKGQLNAIRLAKAEKGCK